uniref:BZIP domain-containing protein n=2 Tax=Hyaloperonospora arabidopsidis (strain Emoy2) TaxID=559515 RepID=M4C0T2_HYAAE
MLAFMTQDTINDPQFPQSEATSSSPPEKLENAEGLKKVCRKRGRKTTVSTTAPKTSAGSPEEQKKQRRRSQIATGVQRHREKKKCLVSSLQVEMTQLTTKLATLRAARRAQLANSDELVAYEEEVMTQRRKRKQAEQNNQMLKHALFQQTMFLGGMKAMMGGSNLLLSKTLEFHDWVHSYTALSASDTLVRRKEYVAHFPRSKMELAKNIVIRNTEDEAQRLLATRQMFSGSVRILHDGTRERDDAGVFGRPNGSSNDPSSSSVDDAGDGRVIKEFSSVFFYPETDKCTLYTLMDIASLTMKSIGMYYSGVSYEARAADDVQLVEDDGMTNACVYYSNLAALMEPVFEVVDDADSVENIDVEARVRTREQCGRDEGIIFWDYVDDDSLHPIPADSTDRKAIRRNVCGANVVRREIGTGLLSVRHVSTKAYCPLPKPKHLNGATEPPEVEKIRRAVARRIGLQAAEFERTRDRL